ncbi:MAG TPA: hypothetical protein VE078_18740, partial [Thermoanaerobaculia bacterium]|nr:hypothetical protein [Thermoanaerobaculia bacterium]
MNAGRFAFASVGVFIVRTVLNFLFYGYGMKEYFDGLNAAHPGVFREVIPAFVALDLVSAILIVYLFMKAGAAFG